MLKNILFISYDGLTDPLGESQVLPYLMGLTKHGYRFTILSCEKPGNYSERKNRILNLIKDYPIEWVSLSYHKNPPVLSAMYDVNSMRRKAAELHKKKNFDLVHTRPGIPTLVGLWLKKKYGVKFLNDIRGFWADERVDGKMWNLSNPLYKSVYNFFKRHEYECLEKADFNTCLTHAAKSEMLSWDQIKSKSLQMEVIPCSTDMELFDPLLIDQEIKKKLAAELRIDDSDFIISYLGSVGGWYLMDEMMRFCKMVSHKYPEAKFLFISPHRHELIADAAAKHKIDLNKIITRAAMRNEIPALLSFSNYSLYFIKPCYSKISSSPTKQGEIMAMGIPVITNTGVGDVKAIVESNNAGILVEDFSDETFNSVINGLSKTVFNTNNIRIAALKLFSLDNAVEKYKKIYDQVLAPTSY